MKVLYKAIVILLVLSTTTFAQVHTVSMVDNEFVPADITVQEGDTVIWVNDGSNIHTTTSGTNCTSDGNWDSGNMETGEEFGFIFSTAGDYPYFCIPHCGLAMDGSVTVEETSSSHTTNLENIKVYPNPVSDRLQVLLPERAAAGWEITLLDLQGKIVSKVISGDAPGIEEVDVSRLNQGMYFLQLRKDGKSYTVKRIMKVE